MNNKIFILAGPSGSGKTTLANRLLNEKELNLHKVITYTTRAPRPGEVNGKDYHFISETTFLDMLRKGEFIEHAPVFKYFYGTTQKSIEACLKEKKNVILILDVKGHQTFRKTNLPICSMFLTVPSVEVLAQRLKNRNTDSEDTIQVRLKEAVEEMKWQEQFDTVIATEDFEQTFQDLKKFISEKNQTKPKLKS